MMEPFTQKTFADIDKVFSRLDQLQPPTDFPARMKLIISRFPLSQLYEADVEHPWDDEGLMVHHEYKHPS